MLQVVVPDKFCDARVQVMQADARTLPPSVLSEYAPQASSSQHWSYVLPVNNRGVPASAFGKATFPYN